MAEITRRIAAFDDENIVVTATYNDVTGVLAHLDSSVSRGRIYVSLVDSVSRQEQREEMPDRGKTRLIPGSQVLVNLTPSPFFSIVGKGIYIGGLE